MEEYIGFMTCRLCLSGDNGLINIFDSKECTDYKPADVITELLRHEVSAGDKYPQSICNECLKKLNEFKRFKERCNYCKELLDRAHTAKIFSSTATAQRENPGHNNRRGLSGNIDIKESLSLVDNDPLAESEVEPDEIVDIKPFVESISSLAVEEVLPELTQSPGHNNNSHFSGNIEVNKSLPPVDIDPLAESDHSRNLETLSFQQETVNTSPVEKNHCHSSDSDEVSSRLRNDIKVAANAMASIEAFATGEEYDPIMTNREGMDFQRLLIQQFALRAHRLGYQDFGLTTEIKDAEKFYNLIFYYAKDKMDAKNGR